MSVQSPATLDIAVLTDVGLKRQKNEDSYKIVVPPVEGEHGNWVALFVIADGMGGLGGGEVASQTAIKEIFKYFYSPDHAHTPLEQRLYDALETANVQIRKEAPALNLKNIGSTAAGLALTATGQLLIFNVGDARVYRIREGTILRLSQDQSLLEARIGLGMTREEAAQATNNSLVTAYLGQPKAINPELRPEAAQPGDIYVICSDGLWNLVRDDEILKIVAKAPAAVAVKELIRLALKRGGHDNVTTCVVRLGKPPQSSRPFVLLAAIVALIAILGLGGVVIAGSGRSLGLFAPLTATRTATSTVLATVSTIPTDNATSTMTASKTATLTATALATRTATATSTAKPTLPPTATAIATYTAATATASFSVTPTLIPTTTANIIMLLNTGKTSTAQANTSTADAKILAAIAKTWTAEAKTETQTATPTVSATPTLTPTF